MSTTRPLVTGPATCVARVPAGTKARTVINAHRKDDRGRKGVGALAII
ncbi:hypothetical protein [Lentzea albida]|uniref:Uncharacterized protein n=1 Tax=Lentzea albida TaxID=65499 RepID=A0A1H9X471_9PSEU|nr:hypothetical protein [Lentzea albida]SES41008.1 hypothetical protein SAMN04488000_12762 [Lentzea albida]